MNVITLARISLSLLCMLSLDGNCTDTTAVRILCTQVFVMVHFEREHFCASCSIQSYTPKR